MTTPIRPLPEEVERWIARIRWLRWLDAGVAWLSLWAATRSMLGSVSTRDAALAAGALLGLGLMVRPLRALWRPISAWVGLTVSRGLHAGDRAWYVRPDHADLVLVTARHGTRMVIATPDLDPDEGVNVRRTRVLLLPSERKHMTTGG
jgi:hypothetical protein